MKSIRTLAAALAITALAAPTALARPADMQASPAKQTADEPRQTQDARTPDAIDAAILPQQQRYDARTPDAIDAATRPVAGPQPNSAPTATDAGGINWQTIALGIAGSMLAFAGIALLTGRNARTRRARVTT